MNIPEENSEPYSGRRWYDSDPALCRALEQLRGASDIYHAQIALNIIKVIVEHQVEHFVGNADDSPAAMPKDLKNSEDVTRFLASGVSSQERRHRRRWYDVHETLSSALQLLTDAPDDLQRRLIPSIVRMVEETLEAV